MPRWALCVAIGCSVGAVMLQAPVAARDFGAAARLRPVLGRTVIVSPVRGTLYVREPGRDRVRVTNPVAVTVRSLIDASRGAVRLTTARNAEGGTQWAIFSGTRFQIFQRRRRNPIGLTAVLLRADLGCRSRAGRKASASRKRRATLHGKSNGNYQTRTGKGAGTVRGTIWDTIDACNFTDFDVQRGSLVVVDFGKTDSSSDDTSRLVTPLTGKFRTRGRHASPTIRGG
jgi:hypothetical protein